MQIPSIRTSAGVDMPGIIYGTAWKKEKTTELVELALSQGFRGIDTACQPKHYDEARVGLALERAYAGTLTRDDLFIQTKFTPIDGHDPERIPYDTKASLSTQVRQSFEVSQSNLKTEKLDSLVLHSPLENSNDLLEVWAEMEAIHSEGLASQIGISNFYDVSAFKSFFESVKVKPAVLQNRFFIQTAYDRELRLFCKENNIVYQSFWTLSANPHILQSSVFDAIASAKKKTPEQILFRYLSYIGVVPLTGTSSKEHMREDLEIFNFELDESEKEKINKLGPFN
jgi:diketogulonate reductase-like aldo/keto reductase